MSSSLAPEAELSPRRSRRLSALPPTPPPPLNVETVREPPPRPGLGPEGKRVFAFGSSGWLFVYYLGVVKTFKAAGLHKDAYLIASSGGASASRLPPLPFPSLTVATVAGCTLFFDVDIDAMVDYVLGCAAQARRTPGGAFRLREYVAGAIERFADPLATPPLLHGNLEVSVTQLPSLRNVRVRDFSNWAKMHSALLATSCIVPLAGLPMRLPGLGWVLDGGLSDLQLVRGFKRSGSFCKVHEGVTSRDGPPKPRRAASARRRRGTTSSESEPEEAAPATSLQPPSPSAVPARPAVTACPFYMSRAAIKPDAYVPAYWAFYPPEPRKLHELYLMGQRNTQAWIDAQNGTAPSETAEPHHAASGWEGYAAAARAAAADVAAEAAHGAESVSAYARTAAAECGRLAAEKAGLLRRARERAVKTLCCILIYAELVAQAVASCMVAAVPFGMPRQRAWERCKSFVAPLPGLAAFALSAPRSPEAQRLLASHSAVLAQLSLLFRLLSFHLS